MRTATARTLVRIWLVALFASGSAWAQSDETTSSVPLDRFRPTIDDRGLLSTEGGDVIGHREVQGGVVLNYALNPLVLRNTDDQVVASIVSHRLVADAMVVVGLLDVMSLGVALPVTLLQLGGDVPAEVRDVVGADGLAMIGVGDLRLIPKVRLLRHERHGVSVSILPAITLPTASGVRFGDELRLVGGGDFLGEGAGRLAFIPEVAVSSELFGLRPALSVAYRLRNPTRLYDTFPIDPELVYRLGVGFDLGAASALLAGGMVFGELFGATSDQNPFGLVDATDAAQVRLHNPLEGLVGVRWRLFDSVVVDGGVGTGVSAGFGTPDLRIFVGIRSSAVRDDDHDDDGLADAFDRCPDASEDHDRFADVDGCPDDDNDGDGVLDQGDACPDIPEDRDGFLDGDGCVDDDNDGDAVKDSDDRCPDLAGGPMSRGCPSDAWIPSPDDAADTAADTAADRSP
jgi:hypothetical protein